MYVDTLVLSYWAKKIGIILIWPGIFLMFYIARQVIYRKTKKGIIANIKGFFRSEFIWRVFVVLQVAGIIGVIVLDSTSRWNLLPEISRYSGQSQWDFFEERWWSGRGSSREPYNFIAMAFLFVSFWIPNLARLGGLVLYDHNFRF